MGMRYDPHLGGGGRVGEEDASVILSTQGIGWITGHSDALVMMFSFLLIVKDLLKIKLLIFCAMR